MNDDLKAYVDGELPPEAVARLREALDVDPRLAKEAEDLRRLSAALRRLPEPEPLGQAATLAAIGQRSPSLARGWLVATVACAGVLCVASWLGRHAPQARILTAKAPLTAVADAPVEATIPAVRRKAFVRFVHGLGGEVRKDGEGLRAFYPQAAHEELKRRFLLPEGLSWPTDGLRVRLAR